MENIFGYVYKITNDINNKFYIGQSINDVNVRFQRHIGDSIGKRHLNTHFGRAIRKYGPEHFHVEIIDTAYNQEELTKKEYEWIKNTNATKYGYNETYAEYKCGGNTYRSKTQSEMVKINSKISKRNSRSGNGNSRAIKMKNIHTGEEIFFDSIKSAQIHFNDENHCGFGRRCSHIINKPYKDEWLVAYKEDDYNGSKPSTSKKSFVVGSRKIEVENLETGETTIYTSYRDFERKNDLKYKSVAVKVTYHKGDTFIFRSKYKITLLN